MSGIIPGLAGAGGAANNAGNYYNQALDREVNSTTSPAANAFIATQNRALQPQFNSEDADLTSYLASKGITNSGSARSDFSDLGVGQSAAIASADAPLYQAALNQYGAINAQEPGAQESAYNDAISQFYQALQEGSSMAGAAFGLPSAGGGGGGATAGAGAPYGSSAYYTQSGVPYSP
jgi:hypothetical protein